MSISQNNQRSKFLKDRYNEEILGLVLPFHRNKSTANKLPKGSALTRKLAHIFPRGKKAGKFLFQ